MSAASGKDSKRMGKPGGELRRKKKQQPHGKVEMGGRHLYWRKRRKQSAKNDNPKKSGEEFNLTLESGPQDRASQKKKRHSCLPSRLGTESNDWKGGQ